METIFFVCNVSPHKSTMSWFVNKMNKPMGMIFQINFAKGGPFGLEQYSDLKPRTVTKWDDPPKCFPPSVVPQLISSKDNLCVRQQGLKTVGSTVDIKIAGFPCKTAIYQKCSSAPLHQKIMIFDGLQSAYTLISRSMISANCSLMRIGDLGTLTQ